MVNLVLKIIWIAFSKWSYFWVTYVMIEQKDTHSPNDFSRKRFQLWPISLRPERRSSPFTFCRASLAIKKPNERHFHYPLPNINAVYPFLSKVCQWIEARLAARRISLTFAEGTTRYPPCFLAWRQKYPGLVSNRPLCRLRRFCLKFRDVLADVGETVFWPTIPHFFRSLWLMGTYR